jgi:hypothetical protein
VDAQITLSKFDGSQINAENRARAIRVRRPGLLNLICVDELYIRRKHN